MCWQKSELPVTFAEFFSRARLTSPVHQPPYPMLRFSFSLFTALVLFSSLNAQTETASTGRLTTQQLSPAEAELLKETKEVEVFGRRLASLKTAFAEKDASRIVGFEAHLIGMMRNETDQEASKGSGLHLEKMTAIFESFEGHTFDPAQPEAAARDFAKLDEFYKIMQEVLQALKG